MKEVDDMKGKSKNHTEFIAKQTMDIEMLHQSQKATDI
jgi:hypothetical protein